MDPLDPHHLGAGRSRYDPQPPPPSPFLASNHYPHHHHHLHHHHHDASLPPPPPAYHQTHHQPHWDERTHHPRPDDDRFYTPYPHPPDPFIPPPPHLRIQERLAPPEDHYLAAARPHRSGHGEVFLPEPWDRRDFDADRFRSVDGRSELTQLRWEEEERRRIAASCREDSYPENALEKKRFRWAQDPNLRGDLGGSNVRHLNPFDGEGGYKESSLVAAFPASSWRVPRSAYMPERDAEVGSIDDRRFPPQVFRSSAHSFSERYTEGRREEVGSVVDRQLLPLPTFSSHSYSDRTVETLERDANPAYDSPADYRSGIGSDYSSQEGYFMNKSKRRMASGGNDYNQLHSPIKQPPKRPSALSRLQSGKSVWNRIQQKSSFFPSPDLFSPPSFPDKHSSGMDAPDTSLKSNMPSSSMVPPNSTLPSLYGMDSDVVTPKKRKRNLVEKREKVVVPVVSGTSLSGMSHGVPKRPTSKTSQQVTNNPEVLGKSESSSRNPENGANAQSGLKKTTGTALILKKTEKRTIKSAICRGEEISKSDTTGNSETKVGDGTNLELCNQHFPLAKKPVEKSTADQASRAGSLIKPDSIEHNRENDDTQLRDKVGPSHTDSLSMVVSPNDNMSVSFVQKKSDELVTAARLLTDIVLADNVIDEDHVNHEICGEDLIDCQGHGFLGNNCSSSPTKSSSLAIRVDEKFAVPVGSSSSNLESDSVIENFIKHTREIDENQQSEVVMVEEELKTVGNGQDETEVYSSHLDIKPVSVVLPLNDRDIVLDEQLQDMSTVEKNDTLNEQVNAKPPQSDQSRSREESLALLPIRNSLPSPPKSDSYIFNSEIQDVLHSTYSQSSFRELPGHDACSDNNYATIQGGECSSKAIPLLAVSSLVLEAEECVKSDKITLSSRNTLDQTGMMAQVHESKRHISVESKVLGSENHLNQKTIPSSRVSKEVPTHLIRKAVPSSGHLRNRTWHRNSVPSSTLASNAVLRYPRGDSLSKQSPKKSVKAQNSYVRKGNSLIRKPATEPQLMSSHSVNASIKLRKHVASGSMKFERKGNTNGGSTCSNHTFERPKTPPLPLLTKSSNFTVNPSYNTSHPVSEDAVSVSGNDVQVKPLEFISVDGDDQRIMVSKLSEPSCSKRMTYVKHKSNQLVAAPGPKSGDLFNNSAAGSQILSSFTSSDLYYRKNKNQLVRDASSSDSQPKQEFIPLSNETVDDQRASTASSFNRRSSIIFMKRLDKVRQKAKRHTNFSNVWTLNGEQSHKKGLKLLGCKKVLPYLVPWKRMVYWANTSSLKRRPLSLISQKLQLIKKKGSIYRLSSNGFSLRKAAGSSLKWSRSIERRSKRANEEAALSVAEVQRNIKEKNNFPSALVSEKNDDRLLSAANEELRIDSHTSLIPRRSFIGNNEYIRVGNGNKLVRDPKKLVRILASEKVRWSLHTARLRLARKQQYCQFFTRFGQCNKKDGRCPFIHDSAKIAICTKFLRGSCSNANCKLTHKVIPERMPDCSYFLQGLCTNMSCPYRHVNVNAKALVCEGFLKGYCADGDECRKKHSYECPHFKATGKCPQGSKCKLHHPKGANKSEKRKTPEMQSNSWGRYFDYSASEVGEPLLVSTDRRHTAKVEDLCSDDQFADYISLNIDSDEDSLICNIPMDLHETQTKIDQADRQQDDLDARIKPIRIMRKDYSVLPSLDI